MPEVNKHIPRTRQEILDSTSGNPQDTAWNAVLIIEVLLDIRDYLYFTRIR